MQSAGPGADRGDDEAATDSGGKQRRKEARVRVRSRGGKREKQVAGQVGVLGRLLTTRALRPGGMALGHLDGMAPVRHGTQ